MRRLALFITDRSRLVLAVAGVLLVIAAVFGGPVDGMLGSGSEDFQDPASQYSRTNAELTAASGQAPVFNVSALVRAPLDIRLDASAQDAVAQLAHMLAVQRGFQRELYLSSSRSPALMSRDGRETVVLAAFATTADADAAVSRVRAALSTPAVGARLRAMTVLFGGEAPTNQELKERTTSSLAHSELIALPLLLALSLWFFRGLIAALLPLLVGVLSILLTFLMLRLVDRFTPISIYALNLVSGMGLGLGIDYSLFILYRYREERASGAHVEAAVERALQTAGRTVLFSCVTVAAALTSLLAFPLRFLYSMGIGGGIVALCDGSIALIVLPALLVALGPRIEALSPAPLQRRMARSATATDQHGGWWRLARVTMRRPGSVALVTAVVLVAAAIPAAHLRFTSPGANLLPASAPSHQVETALASNFAANPAEATEIVLRGTLRSAQRLAAAATAVAGRLASVAAARDVGHSTWDITVLAHGLALSDAQQHLLERLRTLAHAYGALVGGATAYFVDQKAAIAAHVLPAVSILTALTASFLFLMSGSLVIPIKALAMNLLSVSVAAGLLVLIFQDGHLSSVLGFTPLGGLEESSLVLMFTITFALATDYEVFVLARIKEAHDLGLANRDAIAVGIERTGRIVTAAALLFCVAIGALATSDLFFTKQLGLGTALAVAIDASLVRALLVPSLMALMGRWNWWAPAPLRRLRRSM